MATDQAIASLITELQKLNRIITNQSSMGAGSEIRGRGRDQYPVDSKQIVEAMEDLKKQQHRTIKVQKLLNKSSNAYVRQVGKNATSLEKLRDIQSGRTEEHIKSFIELRKQYSAGKVDLADYNKEIKELGFTAKDVRKSTEQLYEDFTELHKSLQHLDEDLTETSKSSGKLSLMFTALVAVGKELYDVHTTSMRTGVEETFQQAIQARMMGMSQVDLIETQGQYRKTIESAGMTTTAFAAEMQQSAHAMFTVTGDLKAGAVFAAEGMQTLRQLGAGMNNNTFLKKQQESFKLLHNSLSITADQFNDMNQQLIQSGVVRTQMFKMDKQRRANYFLELQQTRDKLMLDGLTIEQTQKVIEVFEEMGGQGAKSRIKQAAKLQAVMGSLGQGREGAEAAKLLRGGLRGGEDKARFAELMKGATQSIQKQVSGSLTSELAMETILERAGLTNLFQNMQDTVLQEGMKVDTGSATLIANTSSTNEILTKILKTTQISANIMGEGNLAAIGGSLTALAVAFGAKGMIATALASITGGAATAATTTATALAAGGVAATAAVGATGLAAGYLVGTGINKAWESVDPETHTKMQDLIGGTLASILDTSFSATVDSTMSYWGKELGNLFSDATMGVNDPNNRATQIPFDQMDMSRKQQQALERIATATETTNQLTNNQTQIVERTANDQRNLQTEIFQAGQTQNRNIWQSSPRANMVAP
jgi:hypothetical protein